MPASSSGSSNSSAPGLAALQERIGVVFTSPRALEHALTHKSYANEHRLAQHNERLEFLGDAVLSLIVSDQLMRSSPGSSEGDLSRLRAAIVSEPSLASVGRELGLGEFLLLGRGEDQSGGRDNGSILADTVEALIAAIYLDAGLGQATAFVLRFFGSLLDGASSSRLSFDHKTALQELCQNRFKLLPEYRLSGESGPDHRKEFSVEVAVKDRLLGRGTGRTKKEAEQRAAEEAIQTLGSQETGSDNQKND